MAEIKTKLPRPRDYWLDDAIQTAETIYKWAHGETEEMEFDMQELRWFSEFVLYKMQKEKEKINQINREEADKQYFEHDRFME